MWGPDMLPKHGKPEMLKKEEKVGGGRGGKDSVSKFESGMLRIAFNHL